MSFVTFSILLGTGHAAEGNHSDSTRFDSDLGHANPHSVQRTKRSGGSKALWDPYTIFTSGLVGSSRGPLPFGETGWVEVGRNGAAGAESPREKVLTSPMTSPQGKVGAILTCSHHSNLSGYRLTVLSSLLNFLWPAIRPTTAIHLLTICASPSCSHK